MLSYVEEGNILMSNLQVQHQQDWPQWQRRLILNSSQQPQAFSTQIAMFSWHLCNRRDARVGSHTHAKKTIIRKKPLAKSYIFAFNKTENTSAVTTLAAIQ